MHQPEESSMRMHKPGFKDPKLIVGLILILISIAGVIGIIRINNQTYTYYTAKNDISIGQKITIFHVSNLNQESISLCGKFLRGSLLARHLHTRISRSADGLLR